MTTKKISCVPLYWLFHRDPSNGFIIIPTWLGSISSTIYPRQPGSICSLLRWHTKTTRCLAFAIRLNGQHRIGRLHTSPGEAEPRFHGAVGWRLEDLIHLIGRCFLAGDWTTHLKNMFVKLDHLPRKGVFLMKAPRQFCAFAKRFSIWKNVWYVWWVHFTGSLSLIACCLYSSYKWVVVHQKNSIHFWLINRELYTSGFLLLTESPSNGVEDLRAAGTSKQTPYQAPARDGKTWRHTSILKQIVHNIS